MPKKISKKQSSLFERSYYTSKETEIKLLTELEHPKITASWLQDDEFDRKTTAKSDHHRKSSKENHAQKPYKILFRTMYANTSLLKKIISDPTLAYPIQPWKTVKSEISTNLMNSKSLFASENANVHLDDSGLQSGNGSNSSNNSTAISMTIPHGFQLIRSLEHSKPTLKSVIYVPPTTTTELFVSLDTHNLHVWRGSNRIRKINTAGIQTVKINDLPISKGGTGQAGVFGINRWKYVDSLKIFVVASTQLQLRVLDSHFDELSNVLTPKPVLW
ncbi:hypothetical protein HK098_004160 [Nowakowskiella sp. JEL0407]|nr:hypothetical protein HK098_004160 [Nowakowskiella sp. JEL0407]